MTVNPLYPTVLPTLNLDFANSKRLDPRVTFTRASVATYVGADGLIKTAASGEPRFDHNPTTGECLGLLVEEARTNLILNSGSASSWTNKDGTPTIISTTNLAPDGTSTATSLILSPVNYFTGKNLIIAPSSSVHTVSVYVKNAETTNNFTIEGGGRISFSFTGSILSSATIETGAPTNYGFTNVGNGWYRVWVTMPPNTDKYSLMGWTAGIGKTLQLWGAQVELGSFPTSYIPTTTATVTRSADVASMTGADFSSWYNQNEGTMFVADRGAPSTGTGGKSFCVAGSSTTTFSRLGAYSATNSAFDSFAPGGSQDVNFITANTGTLRKHAAGLANNNTSYCLNGVIIGTDTSCQISGRSIDSAKIGDNIAANAKLNGTIARLAYYPVRLPNAQLQALTAT